MNQRKWSIEAERRFETREEARIIEKRLKAIGFVCRVRKAAEKRKEMNKYNFMTEEK